MLQDGTLVQIVGIAEDGKYLSLTEDQEPAVFLAALRSPANQSHLVVRSHRDPQNLATAMRNKMRVAVEKSRAELFASAAPHL